MAAPWKNTAFAALLLGAAFAAGRTTATKTADAALLSHTQETGEPPSAPAEPAKGLSVSVSTLKDSEPPRCERAPAEEPKSAAEIAAALDTLDRQKPCEQREDERLRLIEAWAAKDPKAALAYVQQNLKGDRRAQATANVITTWAKHQPKAAWQWARSLGPDQAHHTHTVLEQVAKDDPALAARFAAEFSRERPEDAVAMSLTAMRGMTYNGNFEAAVRLASDVRLPATDDQGVLLNFAAGQWARTDPKQAADWVERLPPGVTHDQALVGLGASWAEVDPERAADFAVQLPRGPSRQLALQQAIGNWILVDPSAAGRWINQFELDQDFDQAIVALATLPSLADEHVDLALSWASTIVDLRMRSAALSLIIANWAARKPAEAIGYLRSANLPNDLRAELLQKIQGQNP
jgi:hypothetical protein